MKPKQLLLGVALAAAAALAAFGDNTPQPRLAEPVARAPLAKKTAASAMAGDSKILRVQARGALIGNSADAFKAGDNAVFAAQDWTPPPPPPLPAPLPPPPKAPPLPFTYIGKSVGQGTWEVYLARGDRVYVVRDKDVIDGSYRVESIAPPLMTLTYLPLNQLQQLTIGGFD